MDWFLVISSVLKTVSVIFLIVLPMVAYTVYAERRVSAFIQDRLGPNRVGFQGLAQPIADAVKLFLKEDFTPAYVNKLYFWLAPALTLFPSFMVMAVIPFGSYLNIDPLLAWLAGLPGLGFLNGVSFGAVPMVIANIDAGILFIFAITSLSVYGITLAGWSSNSKYPFLGGIRSSSQMISYELGLGMSVIPIFLIIGSLNLPGVVAYQIEHGWFALPFIGGTISLPPWQTLVLWVPVLISFLVFTISIFAETNRLPFDLPEAETELVGGYHTEYSSMKFALFFLGEYAAMIAGASVLVTLFLGGWSLPYVPSGEESLFWGLVNIGVFFGKVACVLFFFIWVRWTLPRFRYDQLMRLGWIYIFEIAFANIFLTAFLLAYLPKP